jgi:hypothetical protein
LLVAPHCVTSVALPFLYSRLVFTTLMFLNEIAVYDAFQLLSVCVRMHQVPATDLEFIFIDMKLK